MIFADSTLAPSRALHVTIYIWVHEVQCHRVVATSSMQLKLIHATHSDKKNAITKRKKYYIAEGTQYPRFQTSFFTLLLVSSCLTFFGFSCWLTFYIKFYSQNLKGMNPEVKVLDPHNHHHHYSKVFVDHYFRTQPALVCGSRLQVFASIIPVFRSEFYTSISKIGVYCNCKIWRLDTFQCWSLFWEPGCISVRVKALRIVLRWEFYTSISEYIQVYQGISEIYFLLITILRARLHQCAGQGSGLRYGAVNPLTFLMVTMMAVMVMMIMIMIIMIMSKRVWCPI